jgi:hypothetical protein
LRIGVSRQLIFQSMPVRYLFLVVVSAVMGCSHNTQAPTTVGAAIPPASKFLVASEIAEAHADQTTVYQTLARLRPNWLAAHGSSSLLYGGNEYATVYVNGQPYGQIDSLRNLQSYYVVNIRYYDVTEAGAVFGIRGGTGGVIDVRMK